MKEPMKPKSRYKRNITVAKEPRFEGESNSNNRNTMVTILMMKSWTPEPIKILKIILFLGVLKTSPWTNFQPISSTKSSSKLTSLYLAMSFFNVFNKT